MEITKIVMMEIFEIVLLFYFVIKNVQHPFCRQPDDKKCDSGHFW